MLVGLAVLSIFFIVLDGQGCVMVFSETINAHPPLSNHVSHNDHVDRSVEKLPATKSEAGGARCWLI
jgi:hypothetical protein